MILRAVEPAPRLSAHPAAAIVPLMSGDQFRELVADVRANGLVHPIVLHPDERILDGRSRYEACAIAGVPIRTIVWDGEPGTEASWVASTNLRRRHLSTSQRAMIGAKLRAYEVEARKSGAADLQRGRSSEHAATEMKVSERSVDSAAKVMREGAPELVEAVERGEASVDAAAAIVGELPKSEQAELVARGPEEIMRMAAELRRAGSRTALHSSKSNEHYTPAEIVEPARELLGGRIPLDPASCAKANEVVRAERFFTIEDDGLSKEWDESFFLNPPYGTDDETNASNQGTWTARALEQHEQHDVDGLLVVNAGLGRAWFRPLWNFAICFPHKRIPFLDENLQPQKQPTQANAIVYLGNDLEAFVRLFSPIGQIFLPTTMPGVSIAPPDPVPAVSPAAAEPETIGNTPLHLLHMRREYGALCSFNLGRTFNLKWAVGRKFTWDWAEVTCLDCLKLAPKKVRAAHARGGKGGAGDAEKSPSRQQAPAKANTPPKTQHAPTRRPRARAVEAAPRRAVAPKKSAKPLTLSTQWARLRQAKELGLPVHKRLRSAKTGGYFGAGAVCDSTLREVGTAPMTSIWKEVTCKACRAQAPKKDAEKPHRDVVKPKKSKGFNYAALEKRLAKRGSPKSRKGKVRS